MSCQTFELNNCRICWTESGQLDWSNLVPNHGDLTYRDCYYKYTQLECIDDDNLSNMICHICINGLNFIDTFISKAVETNIMLRDMIFDSVNNKGAMMASTADSEMILVEEIEIKEEEVKESSILCAKEKSFRHDELNQTRKNPGNSKKLKNKAEKEIPNKIQTNERLKQGTGETTKIALLVRQLRKYYCDISNSASKRRKKRKAEKLLDKNSNEGKLEKTKLTQFQSNATSENNSKNFGNQLNLPSEKVLVEKTKAKKTDEKIFLCQYCSAECKGWYKLHTHEAKHTEVRERTEACVQCGVKFYDKVSLRLHEKIHDPNREKKFKCEYCEKAFYGMGSLNVHKRIHLGLMVKCQICSKEFFRNIELYKHMNSHSSTLINVDVKKRSRYFVRCKHCGKKIQSASFKSHTAAHLNQPLVKCSICNKEYFNRESCRHHIRTIHMKNPKTVNDYVVSLKTNRMTHLYISQNADVEREIV